MFQTLRVSLFLNLDVRGKLSSKFVQTSKCNGLTVENKKPIEIVDSLSVFVLSLASSEE